MLLTVSIPLQTINPKHIYYKEIIKNKILHNSTFSKLQYSNTNCTINGIPIFVNLKRHTQYAKFKFFIHKDLNTVCINKIIQLEEYILTNYNCNKTPVYKLKDMLLKSIIKINTEQPISNNFIIKLAGIWESNTEYGLTYRISNHT